MGLSIGSTSTLTHWWLEAKIRVTIQVCWRISFMVLVDTWVCQMLLSICMVILLFQDIIVIVGIWPPHLVTVWRRTSSIDLTSIWFHVSDILEHIAIIVIDDNIVHCCRLIIGLGFCLEKSVRFTIV